jgi:hypothetical protein
MISSNKVYKNNFEVVMSRKSERTHLQRIFADIQREIRDRTPAELRQMVAESLRNREADASVDEFAHLDSANITERRGRRDSDSMSTTSLDDLIGVDSDSNSRRASTSSTEYKESTSSRDSLDTQASVDEVNPGGLPAATPVIENSIVASPRRQPGNSRRQSGNPPDVQPEVASCRP